MHAKLPNRGSEDVAGYNLYTCKPEIIPARTPRYVDIGISIAAPITRLYARIALRSGLGVKGLDIGAGEVDSYYRGSIQVLLITNSDTPFQINIGDHMAQLILERIENPECICKSTVFYRTPAPIIVYYFPYITCLLYLLFLIKHVRTSG